MALRRRGWWNKGKKGSFSSADGSAVAAGRKSWLMRSPAERARRLAILNDISPEQMSARGRKAAAARLALNADPQFLSEVLAAAEVSRYVRDAKKNGHVPPVIMRRVEIEIPYDGVRMPACVKHPGITQRRRERREAAVRQAREQEEASHETGHDANSHTRRPP
jgi:hypothetical protein